MDSQTETETKMQRNETFLNLRRSSTDDRRTIDEARRNAFAIPFRHIPVLIWKFSNAPRSYVGKYTPPTHSAIFCAPSNCLRGLSLRFILEKHNGTHGVHFEGY